MTISLSEPFRNISGEFNNYDSYNVTQREAIRGLKHRDIRTFVQSDITIPGDISFLDMETMDELDPLQVSALTTTTVTTGEGWTGGSVTADATLNHIRTLALTCGVGSTASASQMLNNPVDILNDFSSTDSISIALPSFPLPSVNTASSKVTFREGAHLVDVFFNQSTTTLVNGHSEFRFPRSLIEGAGLDLSRIDTIVFTIVATALCTVKINALRILGPDWTYGAIDMDTFRQRLRYNPPLNGNPATLPAFVWPTLWKSSEPAGANDPLPIDAQMGVTFNPGTITQTSSFTMYFREVSKDFMTQLDLNPLVQAQLDGGPQPDIGESALASRIQLDIDPFMQDELDDATQSELEASNDQTAASWIQFTCQWGTATTRINIIDTEGNGYTFDIAALTNNQNYVFFALLEENTARAALYTMDASNRVGTKIFDSTVIMDDFAFIRRKGRYGWLADLKDGDSFIRAFQARKFNFAEYRSAAIESNTPVVGAELFAGGTPNFESYDILAPGPFNLPGASLIERDTDRSTTGESWRVKILGTAPIQGVQTNFFEVTDFDNTEVSFDLFVPSDALVNGANYQALLMSEYNTQTPLLMPLVFPDEWQHIRVLMPFDETVLTGFYRFILIQDNYYPTTWWIDNLSIASRSVEWEGRSIIEDPWGGGDAQWVPFRNNVSKIASGGVMFAHRGRQLQIRGRAMRQDASIDHVQFIPKYAQLGRFKPNTSNPSIAPVGGFSSSVLTGTTVRLTGTSTDSDGYISLYEWNFGDGGIGVGPVVDHTYAASGVYTITLVTMDNNGNRNVYTNTVAV